MSNGTYTSVDFQDANQEKLAKQFCDQELVVTTDVAKDEMYTGLAGSDGEVERIVTWQNADELEAFVDWIDGLQARDVVLVIEPSGTYGEPLRQAAEEAGWEVRLVTPKRLNDAAEVFDGVPSLHDAKSSWLLAKLHGEGLSEPWGLKDDVERRLDAYIRGMSRHGQDKRRKLGKLESRLAAFWPEVTTLLKMDSATLLALLEFGGPQEIADNPEQACKLMKRVSRGQLRPEKREAILESARTTDGKRMVAAEQQELADLAAETDRARRKERLWRSRVEEAVEAYEDAAAVGDVVGAATSGVFRAKIGDFRDFEAPAQLLKKFGLNLKEKSSGKDQGQLKISKRGPGVARSYLYWATLRLIDQNPVFRAWHTRKVERDGGIRSKSVVALMRKLVKGLWHVARGEKFDATKLFDTTRLDLDEQHDVAPST